MKNAVNREIPSYIEGYGNVVPFSGAYCESFKQQNDISFSIKKQPLRYKGDFCGKKLMNSIDDVLDYVGIRDGMTVSFHHHLRNGDFVTNTVMAAIARRGIKDIHVAASGLFQCHDPLAELVESGTISKITLSTISRGKLADAIVSGKLKQPAVFMTHGGRVRAIKEGSLHIDVAFIAAPAADVEGNANGQMGDSACGMLSYAYIDSLYADYVVVITDNLQPYPLVPAEIEESKVDCVLKLDKIGDPEKIAFGPTKMTDNPDDLLIASKAAELIDAAGYIKDGMSFQTGAGAISLAVARYVGNRMAEKNIKGSFIMGGATGILVDLLREGLFNVILDVQCFDTKAVQSVREDKAHVVVSAERYAALNAKSTITEHEDIIILGATEIDTDFNVNVVTGSNGKILSAAGGNSDCAAGSSLSVIVSKLVKGKYNFIKDSVTTIVTPGETVDLLVTDRGCAVNPRRQDLIEKFKANGIEMMSIQELKALGDSETEVLVTPKTTNDIVAVIEYCDGSVIDVVKKLAEE